MRKLIYLMTKLFYQNYSAKREGMEFNPLFFSRQSIYVFNFNYKAFGTDLIMLDGDSLKLASLSYSIERFI